ncbi:hypothetical protein K503DRAFT_772959 [Rhizopogon vinicolor AM-OR11-026]|uniref:Ricin B lectin domain-containing protein n=1 Tax=Rhizopogon vinicolor AM-OR11-026 TaxID=1314800 RepID=A0A1B7MTV3_9AGAM|nr:hypothetical protein K503DRAFT_772959 [Rhizopogon vinicolor AM-OR11-026]
MADFPVPQNYYVITSESVGSDKPVGMIWDEGVVRAVPGKKTIWSVQCVNKETGLYTGRHTESGCAAGLSVNSDGSPVGVAGRLDDMQHWTLKKAGDGFSVSREFNGVELYTYIDDNGNLTASPLGMGRIQSFVFQPANSE